jgi:hypothetical protein
MDIARYQTYAWAPKDALSTGDPRLDNNPFFHERVQQAVERELAAKGLEKVTSEKPDLLIHYHASVTQEIDLGRIDKQYTNCDPSDCQPYVYDAGTLLVDFVEADSHALVWRGWADDTLDGAIDNQAWLEEKVDAAVAGILERFPRRQS